MSEPYEARCTEETAIRMKEGESASNQRPVPIPFFQAALGIPLIVSKDVPVGRVQIWKGDEMVKEIVL